MESSDEKKPHSADNNESRLVGATATGNIYRVPVQGITAPLLPLAIVLRELSRRAVYPEAVVHSDIAKQVSGMDAFMLHSLMSGMILRQFAQMDAAHKLAFIGIVISVAKTTDAGGLESILASCVNQTWHWAPERVTKSLIEVIRNDVSSTTYGNTWPVFARNPIGAYTAFESSSQLVIDRRWRRLVDRAQVPANVSHLPKVDVISAAGELGGPMGTGVESEFGAFWATTVTPSEYSAKKAPETAPDQVTTDTAGRPPSASGKTSALIHRTSATSHPMARTTRGRAPPAARPL